jgi:hypothetical protein
LKAVAVWAAQSVLPLKTADELPNKPILEEIEEARGDRALRTKLKPLYAGLVVRPPKTKDQKAAASE